MPSDAAGGQGGVPALAAREWLGGEVALRTWGGGVGGGVVTGDRVGGGVCEAASLLWVLTCGIEFGSLVSCTCATKGLVEAGRGGGGGEKEEFVDARQRHVCGC